MIIQIHIRDKWMNILKNGMISFIKNIYGWVSKDDEFLGHVLGVTHFIISATFYILIIACHTIYPSLYFQIFIFVCIFIIWLQHIIFKVCISVLAEQELTKLDAPSFHFFKLLLGILGISFEDFMNYFIAAETSTVWMFALELLSKLSVHLYRKYDIVY